MSKLRQPSGVTPNRRGISLTDIQLKMLEWLCEQEDRSRSNMIGRLIEQEYGWRNGPPLDAPEPPAS